MKTISHINNKLRQLAPSSPHRFCAYAQRIACLFLLGLSANAFAAAPSFSSANNIAIDEDTALDFAVSVSDGDATDRLTVKIKPGQSLPSWLSLQATEADAWVSTFAGTDVQGTTDGAANQAQFDEPNAIAAGADGTLYVADADNNRIRKISPAGVVSTLAGNTRGFADGTGPAAQFDRPLGIAVGDDGMVYVSDFNNHRIRKITPEGVVTTLAGSTRGFADDTGTAAQFDLPIGIAIDNATGLLYVADSNNNRIRSITPAGVVTTLAGNGNRGSLDGAADIAQFNYPRAMAVDGAGNVYTGGDFNNRIRKISTDGAVATLAGGAVDNDFTYFDGDYVDGEGSAAAFRSIRGITAGRDGMLYVADSENNSIRQVSPAGVVTTFAGGTSGFADGFASTAKFYRPRDVASASDGTFYVADIRNHRIRKITPRQSYRLVGTPSNDDVGSFEVIVEVSDGTTTVEQTITVTVNNTNDTPSGIVLSPEKLGTTSAVGSVAGSLSTQDIDEGDTSDSFSYALVNPNSSNAGACSDASSNSLFSLDGNSLKTAAALSAGVHTVCLQTSDAAGATFEQSLSLFVSAAPQITSASTIAIDEDAALDFAVLFSDSDTSENLSAQIKPGQSLPSWLSLQSTEAEAWVSTFAGTGAEGTTDGAANQAQFDEPYAIAAGADGSLYVADADNHRIRKISPAGVVSTLAGSTWGFADGTGPAAQFNRPLGIAVGDDGMVYVSDFNNHRIRKITPEGVVTTLAGSTRGFADDTGTAAQFDYPIGIAIDNATGLLYVADNNNNRIRSITPAGVVTTLAGNGSQGSLDGAADIAQFNYPRAMAVDGAGNVYTGGEFNNRIRKISTDGAVSTLAGGAVDNHSLSPFSGDYIDGQGSAAAFREILGITAGRDGMLYVADSDNNSIRQVSPAGVVTTLAGGTWGFADGPASTAQFNNPSDVASASDGTFYVTDSSNHRIRKITPRQSYSFVGTPSNGDVGSFEVIVEVSDGTTTVEQTLTVTVNNTNDTPSGIVLSPEKLGTTSAVGSIAGSLSTQDIDEGDTSDSFTYALVSPNSSDEGLCTDATANGNFTVDGNSIKTAAALTAGIHTVCLQTSDAAGATFEQSLSLFVSAAPQITSASTIAIDEDAALDFAVLFSDSDATENLTAQIKPGQSLPNWLSLQSTEAQAWVSTFAGTGVEGTDDGAANQAQFDYPYAIASGADGTLYVADADNHRIRKINPAGEVSTLAGSTMGFADGTGTAAQFDLPLGIAVGDDGMVYVSDSNNHRIRKITPEGVVTTLAGNGNADFADGTGTAAQFDYPVSIAIDDATGLLYIADSDNNRIRIITPEGVVTTLAGQAARGSQDGAAGDALFYWPRAMAVDGNGNVYTGGQINNRIRKISTDGAVSTLAGGEVDNDSTSFNGGYIDDQGSDAAFRSIMAITANRDGVLYVADSDNNSIRQVSPQGVVTTLAGGTSGFSDGSAGTAKFHYPSDVASTSDGIVYVVDTRNNRIRKITPRQNYSFVGTPANGDVGSFDVIIEVSDGTTTVEQTLTVTVNNTNDAPTDLSLSANSLNDRETVLATTVATISTVDEDTADSFSYQLVSADSGLSYDHCSDDADNAFFNISGDELVVDATIAQSRDYTICLQVTDSGGAMYRESFNISVSLSPQQAGINHIVAQVANSNSAALQLADYNAAGITQVRDTMLPLLVNALDAAASQEDIDEGAEIQALVDILLQGQDNDGDGLPNFLEGDSLKDTDGDGLADRDDIDSDGDGIKDAIEHGLVIVDSDGDSIHDAFDADVGNDGVVDSGKTDANGDGVDDAITQLLGLVADTDGDGIVDHLDLDSDNDSLLDVLETGGLDDNEDGLLDAGGVLASLPLPNADADSLADVFDVQSDASTYDITVVGLAQLDTDSDGVIDSRIDIDRDGIMDVVDGAVGAFGSRKDIDGDGLPNTIDEDDDNDSIPDLVENPLLDVLSGLDADNDGIDDGVDAEVSGVINGVDSNNDGVIDGQELLDTDGDGAANHMDGDSDNDGISDSLEAGVDPHNPVDSDGDGIADYLDDDSDNDGISDREETSGVSLSHSDHDGDGIDDVFDVDFTGGSDANNNGIDDDIGKLLDTDGDGIPNHLDSDSDGDNIPDGLENNDIHGDGVSDHLQKDGSVKSKSGSNSPLLILLLLSILLIGSPMIQRRRNLGGAQ